MPADMCWEARAVALQSNYCKGQRWFAKLADKLFLRICVLAMQFMEITDKDDEKAKNKKKKLQKGWKSQQRFAKLDAETQKRQQSWMDFKKGKGSKKKVTCYVAVFLVHFAQFAFTGLDWSV